MVIVNNDNKARDFYKVIKALRSCKTFDQFLSAENMYDNYKRLYFGFSLYEYHEYDDLWDEIWDEVLDRIGSANEQEQTIR